MLLKQEDDGLEDATVEDGYGLPGNEHLITLLSIPMVILAAEIVLPLNEGLVGYQRIVLIIRDLKIPEKLEILKWSKALILVEFHDYLLDEVVAG